MTEVLSFEAFADHLAEGIEMDRDLIYPEANLIEDLGLDSFDLVEVLAIVEELGIRLPDEVSATLETVDDVYREYATRSGATLGRRA